jgi:ABC-2 type transport system permease protein
MSPPPEPVAGRRPRKKKRPSAPASAAAARVAAPDPALRAPRHGWRTVAAKELADHVLSIRFVVLVLILGLAAAGAVYTAAGAIREVASNVAGAPSIFLRLFTFAPEQFPPFVVLVGFLGPLLGIAFGFDGVNGERAEKTLPRLLAQPIHRDDVINGKFVAGLAAIGLIITAVTLVVAGIGVLQLGIVPAPQDIARLLVWIVLAIAYVGFWLAFALLCSVVLRRAATSALVAIGIWIVLTLFAALLVGIIAGFLAPAPSDATADQQIANLSLHQDLARLSPNRLFEEATAAVLDPTVRTVSSVLLPGQADRAVGSLLPIEQSLLVIWPQIVILIGLTALAFALGYISFMRQEVRA